jgi:hypothetical protein
MVNKIILATHYNAILDNIKDLERSIKKET